MLATVVLSAFAAVGSAFVLSTRDGPFGMVFDHCVVDGSVAMTFDDGPYNYHENISDIMTAAGGHATFFINGQNWGCIYDYQDALKHSFAQGHQIASHTWSHADLTAVDASTMETEINKIDAAIENILGVVPACLRPPYGSYNDAVKAAAAAHSKNLIIWDLDSGDSTGSSASVSKEIYDKGKASRTGNILALNHETSKTTVTEVLQYAIDDLKAYGYTKFVTVAECLNIEPYTSVGPAGTPNYSWHCDW
ncbi:carbohydrate esterase family 4 protein [Mycena belliarum]|uniref:Carbohydrate esterase family 4 protein n=1 Tax=Mycena belliarum TaxID=1033014 RepID=A0AAD6TYK0_9AGAR|nr:carbohydrate esterase family 4 protein [Mycena belliae]